MKITTKIDRNLIVFLIAASIVITAFVLYPQLVTIKQDTVLANQEYTIDKINKFNQKRTEQIINLQNNITDKIIQNQQLIKANQEVIKDLTRASLNLTKIISDNFGQEYLDREAFQYKQANNTFYLINHTLNGLNAHEALDNERFQKQKGVN